MEWITLLRVVKRYLPLDSFPADVAEIVRKFLSTDGAGLVTTEEGRVLPSLQADVAEPPLVLLLLPRLPHPDRRLVCHICDPMLNLDTTLKALLHSPAAIKAGNLKNRISIKL